MSARNGYLVFIIAALGLVACGEGDMGEEDSAGEKTLTLPGGAEVTVSNEVGQAGDRSASSLSCPFKTITVSSAYAASCSGISDTSVKYDAEMSCKWYQAPNPPSAGLYRLVGEVTRGSCTKGASGVSQTITFQCCSCVQKTARVSTKIAPVSCSNISKDQVEYAASNICDWYGSPNGAWIPAHLFVLKGSVQRGACLASSYEAGQTITFSCCPASY